MSVFLKPMGYLAAFAATAGVTGCDPVINGQGIDAAAPVKDEQPTPLPRPPIKIPMPLDKAGAKVDVTFEIPPLSKGEKFFSSYFVGLRVLFTSGTDTVFQALEEHPVAARIFLSRIENGEEIPLPPFAPIKRSDSGESSHNIGMPESAEKENIAARYYTQLSGAQPGTPDASAFVLSFGSARAGSIPGMYRLQVETLEDIPSLSGLSSFLVYEAHPRR